MGKLFANLGEINEAERRFKRSANLNPENPEIYLNLASLLSEKDPQKAFAHYRTFFSKQADPSSAKTFVKKVKNGVVRRFSELQRYTSPFIFRFLIIYRQKIKVA